MTASPSPPGRLHISMMGWPHRNPRRRATGLGTGPGIQASASCELRMASLPERSAMVRVTPPEELIEAAADRPSFSKAASRIEEREGSRVRQRSQPLGSIPGRPNSVASSQRRCQLSATSSLHSSSLAVRRSRSSASRRKVRKRGDALLFVLALLELVFTALADHSVRVPCHPRPHRNGRRMDAFTDGRRTGRLQRRWLRFS